MEEDGKVDLGVVPRIDESRAILSAVQKEIVGKEETDVKASFLAYHIIRNLDLALEKMKVRFLTAKENHDNPVVAEDSIPLMPVFAESFDIAVRLMNESKLTQEEEDLVIERIQVLREAVSNSTMQASLSEETKNLSKSEFDDEGKLLADAIQDIYTKEQQDIH